MKKLSDEFREKTGVRILGIAEHGFRHFTAKGVELKTPADMKDLKIRVMENPAHMAMTRGLGASPTPISYSELYMALQQGVVDGMECPIANIHDSKFYEVQDSLVLDGHLYGPLVIFINEDKYQSLTPEQQQALQKGAEAFCIVHAGITAASDAAALKDMADKGMKIHTPTAEEQKMFRNAAQPTALDIIAKRIGQEWVDGAIKAAQDASAKVAGKEDELLQECIREAQEMVKIARGQ